MKKSSLFESAPSLQLLLKNKRVRNSLGEEVLLSSAITERNALRIFDVVKAIRPTHCVEIGMAHGVPRPVYWLLSLNVEVVRSCRLILSRILTGRVLVWNW